MSRDAFSKIESDYAEAQALREHAAMERSQLPPLAAEIDSLRAECDRLRTINTDGLVAAETAYLALLKRHDVWRVHNQHVYCILRDFIAQVTGRNAEDVQDYYELRARMVDTK